MQLRGSPNQICLEYYNQYIVYSTSKGNCDAGMPHHLPTVVTLLVTVVANRLEAVLALDGGWIRFTLNTLHF